MYRAPKEHRIETGDLVHVRYLANGPKGVPSERTGTLVGFDTEWLTIAVQHPKRVKSIRVDYITVVNLIEKRES